MKFVALVSGGKDSCFNILHCLVNGHELVSLANLHPADLAEQELDSFMYQTVGHDVVRFYSDCCEVPLYRQAINGGSKNQKLEYSKTAEDETEDLYLLLERVKRDHPDVEGVSVGAILSSYQRTRVEHVCQRLGLVSLAYLWQRDQLELLTEMTHSGMDARIIKVAAIGLNESHLNKSIQEMLPVMVRLNQMYDVHICGEGGEFETLVLDAPFFKHKKLQVVGMETVKDSGDVCYAKLKVELVPKDYIEVTDWSQFVSFPPQLSEEFQEIEDSLDPVVNDEEEIQAANMPLIQESRFKCLDNKIFISNLTSSKENLEEQVVEVFTDLEKLLDENGVGFENIQSTQLLVSDMANFGRINSIYTKYFPHPLPPARICVETIMPAGQFLQLSVTVLTNIEDKRGVHIQGRSYWAPANIGPYSQAIVDKKNQFSAVSGQIPLIPASMELCQDAQLSTVLSLEHFDSVKRIVNVRETLSMVSFVTAERLLKPVLDSWAGYGASQQDQLIVVMVTSLPRNAKVEWGGLSYTEIERDDDDDDESGAVGKLRSLSLKTNPATLRKVNDQIFDHLFFDIGQSDKLHKLLALTGPDCHFICYCTADAMHATEFKTMWSKFSVEFVPVLQLWNSKGEPHDIAVVLRSA